MNPFSGLGHLFGGSSPVKAPSASIGKLSNNNIGKTTSSLVGFDPTPGFNVTRSAPFISTGGSSTASNVAAKAASSGSQPTGNDGSGAYSGSYAGGGSGGTSSADTNAYYDDAFGQADNELTRLANQEQIGLNNINNGYQNALNTLLGQKAITDRDYNTAKDQTLQDNVQAKGNIDLGVHQHNNALQRLLASHGYSGSANQAASYGAAQQGTQQRTQVSKEFGRNQQALDTNYGDYNNQFNDSRNDLGAQKQGNESKLHSQIATNKAQLLNQLAGLTQQRSQAAGKSYQQALQDASPYVNQVNTLNSQIDQYGADPTYTPKAAVYHAPSLEAYNYDKTSAPTVGGNLAGAADNINPYLSVLLGQDKKQQNSLFGA
jgi:hypothetical protein